MKIISVNNLENLEDHIKNLNSSISSKSQENLLFCKEKFVERHQRLFNYVIDRVHAIHQSVVFSINEENDNWTNFQSLYPKEFISIKKYL